MSGVTEIHEERETLVVDVLLPGHEERTTTALFSRTREELIKRDGGRCYICGRTAVEAGHPLEAHHHPIERSLANMIDWPRFRRDCVAGVWGPFARAFDWKKLDTVGPLAFVDDMTVNGMLLCKDHHTGPDEGVHTLPFPLWVAQRYGLEGYQFTKTEIIHHGG
ncbi:MAG: hypothetical protein CVU73_11165 [Deltaproteobacteria bacterium HGW-Deltaproteobacteria-8]|jgi:hypothetical protein|nr:MAG: hypothetical protein CVU73_11165 [Deltaproteobacteria bacterium HGW-Deltaproteobacteria-8]